MSDEPVPMLNKPKESTCETAERFAENVLGRMSRAHEAFTHLNDTLAGPPDEARKRMEKFREQAFARFEELTGLTFDRETGKCTTEGKVRMEGELKGRWAQLCTRLREERDPQKAEQLIGEAGALLRGAIEKPAERTDS